MKATMKLAMLATGLVFAAAGLVQAQVQARHCGPRDEVVEALATKYGETRKSMGLDANDAMMEVYASAETGSWTITVTTPHGMTCLLASGQAFEEMAEMLSIEGNDA